MWPDYYVRTCEPWTLAYAAAIGNFKPGKGHEFAIEHLEVDGEADYGINATIYDPPADDSDNERDHSGCEDGEDCEGCDMCEPDEMESYSSVNGAWFILEVFPVDDMDSERSSAMRYDSLNEALSADVITLARELA